MRPFWNKEDFRIEDIRIEGIVESDGISISRSVLLRVEMAQGVGRLKIGAMLREKERRVLFRSVL